MKKRSHSANAHRHQAQSRAEEGSLEHLTTLLLETEKVANIGSWSLDYTTGRVEWSPQLYAMFGYPEGPGSREPMEIFTQRLHPDDKEWVLRNVEEAIDKHDTRYRLLFEDGSVKWVESVGISVRDESGRETGQRGYMQDITNRYEIQAARDRASAILERTSVILYVTDSTKERVLHYISEGISHYGFQQNHLIWGQSSFNELVHSECREKLERSLRNALEKGKTSFETKYRINTPTGFAWFKDYTTIIRDHEGNVTQLEGILTDVTLDEERAHRRELENRRTEILLQMPQTSENKDEVELMQWVEGELETLTNSTVSFMHFVNDDEQSIELVAWSKRTLNEYCSVVADRHYPVSEAGIWADALRSRKPVIINDYASYPSKHGLPEGHASLNRFISVPVMSSGKVVMITGVGNKETDYTAWDVETARLLADEVWRIVIQKRHLKAAQENEHRLQGFMNGVYDSFVLYEPVPGEPDFIIRFINDVALKVGGVEREEALGRRMTEVFPGAEESGVPGILVKVRDTGLPISKSDINYQFEGIDQWFDLNVIPLEDGTIGVAYRDRTDIVRKRKEKEALELQLAQSQRLESLGRLAGGVAHDFNNLLGIILGHTDIAQAKLSVGEPAEEHIQQIADAALRSRALTKQLLGFARRQVSEPQVIELGNYLKEGSQLWDRLIGTKLSLHLDILSTPVTVYMDPSQIDQVLSNLCVNAHDATPEKGTVRIGLDKKDRADIQPPLPDECPEGEYAVLEVEDSGSGMDEETLVHLFEPFYTTKPAHKGTGLGLSTVYGIVKQHDGHIQVQSVEGEGTTMTVFLPVRTRPPGA